MDGLVHLALLPRNNSKLTWAGSALCAATTPGWISTCWRECLFRHAKCNANVCVFFRIGTAALAVQVVGSNWPKPHYTLLITGLCRFQIVQVLKEKPYPVAEVEQLDRLEEFPNTCKTREELGELSEQFYRYSVQVGGFRFPLKPFPTGSLLPWDQMTLLGHLIKL